MSVRVTIGDISAQELGEKLAAGDAVFDQNVASYFSDDELSGLGNSAFEHGNIDLLNQVAQRAFSRCIEYLDHYPESQAHIRYLSELHSTLEGHIVELTTIS